MYVMSNEINCNVSYVKNTYGFGSYVICGYNGVRRGIVTFSANGITDTVYNITLIEKKKKLHFLGYFKI